MTASVETHGFQTEISQLLDLMIHSLYSNKEIFLRELISNAADAADKLRFLALSDDSLYEGDADLAVSIEADEKARTLTVRDNGIGMSRQEVIDHIGTIAKSGTAEFFKSLTGDKQKDASLIGQFGVGFYSAFIVADRVTLTTRKAGLKPEEGVRWSSEGKGEYSMETVTCQKRGTEIVLHLREGEDEFLKAYRLREIIRRYSDHISLPIRLPAEDKDKQELETVNEATALWTLSRQEISEDEYNDFYKYITHDFEPPLCHLHSKVEGKLEYTLLLYIPAKAPFDLWERDQRHGVRLYVQRVFIMDDAKHLLPPYLRFVRGVVDSNDLPLNVSREILQHNKVIDQIRAAATKKVLGMIEGLAKGDDYARFWNEFGRTLKEGIIDDPANRETLSGLLRFASTHNDGDEQNVSLADYAGRMQSGQDAIYYVIADNPATARRSPHLEIFRNKGIEVLLLTDPIDEWLVAHLGEYEGKPLKSVSKGDLDLGKLEADEDKKKVKKAHKQHRQLLERISTALKDQVKEVRVSHRLIDSPACLVADENDMGAHMERLLRASGQQIPASKPILEINPEHPLLLRLEQEQDAARFNDWAQILFDQSLLSEGGQLADPAGFVQRLNQMFLAISSDGDSGE